MSVWHRRLMLSIFVCGAALDVPGVARQVAPPASGTASAPALPPKTAAPGTSAPAKPKEKPPPKPDKHGADPDTNGGPAKGDEANVKRCARGRFLALDRGGQTLRIRAGGATVTLRFTAETVLRVGQERGWLDASSAGMTTTARSALKEGAAVTVYCARQGPQDVAALVRVEASPR